MKDLLARASRARRRSSVVAGGSAGGGGGGGGGGGVMSKNPQYLFSPQFFLLSEPAACLRLPPGRLVPLSLQRPKLYKKRLQSTLANTKKLLKLGSKGRLLPGHRPFSSQNGQ